MLLLVCKKHAYFISGINTIQCTQKIIDIIQILIVIRRMAHMTDTYPFLWEKYIPHYNLCPCNKILMDMSNHLLFL